MYICPAPRARDNCDDDLWSPLALFCFKSNIQDKRSLCGG